MTLQLQPADLIFVRGKGLISRLIAFGQNGEPTSHVAIFVGDQPGTAEVQANGDPLRPDLPYADQSPNVVEAHAENGVTRKSVLEYCDNGAEVAIYRMNGLDEMQAARDAVVQHALAQVGRAYGLWKLATSLVDEKLFGGRVWARRINGGDLRPICSVLVADAYAKAGYKWPAPIDPQAATPADLLWAVDLDAQTYPSQTSLPWRRLRGFGPIASRELEG